MSLRPYDQSSLQKLMSSVTPQGISQDCLDQFLGEKIQHNEGVLKAMRDVLGDTQIPFQVIPGNYDSNSSLDAIFGEANLHQKAGSLGSAKLFGYGGADAYPEHIMHLVQMGKITAFDHQELYGLLKQHNPDIALVHNPPQGFCDNTFKGQNVGTPASTKFLAENGPKLILSGHIHEAGPNGNNPKGVEGISAYKNPQTENMTYVLNPGNLGRFELVNPRNLSTIRAFDYGTFIELDVREDGAPEKVRMHSIQGDKGPREEPQLLAQYTLNYVR